ncbi:Uncharacterised protein [Chlamydia trachomatis]|nr:Uncharacterised protein [Chlamydia trachomatis]CRH48666.1 Uncharacterised protein [Chlamydia trachomatis]
MEYATLPGDSIVAMRFNQEDSEERNCPIVAGNMSKEEAKITGITPA